MVDIEIVSIQLQDEFTPRESYQSCLCLLTIRGLRSFSWSFSLERLWIICSVMTRVHLQASIKREIEWSQPTPLLLPAHDRGCGLTIAVSIAVSQYRSWKIKCKTCFPALLKVKVAQWPSLGTSMLYSQCLQGNFWVSSLIFLIKQRNVSEITLLPSSHFEYM